MQERGLCTATRDMPSASRIIIDTDPGVDDALALLLAFAAAEVTVEALTIVCGNGKDINQLGANAKLLARIAGCADVPICLGAAPLLWAGGHQGSCVKD